jgi:hypothetical protein
MPTWAIEGADEVTGQDISLEAVYDSEADVEKWARQNGVLVGSIVRLPDKTNPRTKVASEDPQIEALHRLCDDVRLIRLWVSFAGIILALLLIGWTLFAIAGGLAAAGK